MRYGFIVLFLAASINADAQQNKKSETQYTFGFAFQEGAINPPLSLENNSRVSAGVLLIFGEVFGEFSRISFKTTALGGFQGLQTHSVQIQSNMGRLGPLRFDVGFEIEYHEQPVSIFTHDRTDIRSNEIHGSGLMSFLVGAGRYRDTYVRAGVLGGAGYIEQRLELFVDDSSVSRNRSEITSGVPVLYGIRLQGGTHLLGIRVEGTATELFVDGVPRHVMENQLLLSGSISYQTPWYVGVYAKAAVSTGNPSILFLGNTLTFGITGNLPK